MAIRYKYKIVSFHSAIRPDDIEASLNDLGAAGWMLVHVNDHAHGKDVIFMRTDRASEAPPA